MAKLTLVRPPPAVEEVAEIDPSDLINEFAQHASDVLYWGWNLAAAQDRVAEAKMALEEEFDTAREQMTVQLEEECDDGERKRGRGQAPGGLTAPAFESLVNSQPAVRDAQAEYLKAQGAENRIRRVLNALDRKGEMLISLGAHERKARDAGARQ